MCVDCVGPMNTCPSFGKHEWQEEADIQIVLLSHEIILADVKIATLVSPGRHLSAWFLLPWLSLWERKQLLIQRSKASKDLCIYKMSRTGLLGPSARESLVRNGRRKGREMMVVRNFLQFITPTFPAGQKQNVPMINRRKFADKLGD